MRWEKGVAACFALALAGCGARSQEPRAPQLLAVHADAAPLVDFHGKPGLLGGVDAEFESVGCCSFGAYAATASLTGEDVAEGEKPPDDDPVADRVTSILDGGVQLGFIVPGLQNRMRLRARAGKSGTPPQAPLLGRGGFSTSAAVLVRIWDVDPIQTDEAAGNIDAFLGYVHWRFDGERTAAGFEDDKSIHNAVLFGLRLGVDYGVDFE